MSEYTPTTKQVEDGFSYEPEYEYLNPVDGGYAERNRRAFRRWLAEHDRQVEIAVIEKLIEDVYGMEQAFVWSEVGTVVRKLDLIEMLREQAQKRREGENDE